MGIFLQQRQYYFLNTICDAIEDALLLWKSVVNAYFCLCHIAITV